MFRHRVREARWMWPGWEFTLTRDRLGIDLSHATLLRDYLGCELVASMV